MVLRLDAPTSHLFFPGFCKTPQYTSKVLRVQAGMWGLRVIMDPYERRLLANQEALSCAVPMLRFSSSLRCALAHARPTTSPSVAITRAAGEVPVRPYRRPVGLEAPRTPPVRAAEPADPHRPPTRRPPPEAAG